MTSESERHKLAMNCKTTPKALMGQEDTKTDPSLNLAESDSALLECQAVVGHFFSDITHLKAALVHASGADSRLASNERLEFLGDAIMGAVVCSHLFHQYPGYLEGDLTRIKSAVVSRRTCAKVARELGMDRFLKLGKGMGDSSQAPESILADLFESVVAAVYLDGGFEAARRVVIQHMNKEIVATVAGDVGMNYKSALQQLAQKQFGRTPTYNLLEEKGPDHLKCFLVAARIGNRQFKPAWGNNKKDAEQIAARHALDAIAEDLAAS